MLLNVPAQVRNQTGVIEKDGVFHYNTRTRVTDVTDGASCTVLFGERSHREPRWRFMGFRFPSQQDFAVFARWYTGGIYTGRQPLAVINYRLPEWVETDPPRPNSPAWLDLYSKRLGSYGSGHPGGCNLVMADGSVRFVAEYITLPTLHALVTKSGGEALVAD
jgi:prepilin-type processing-associated H-X9-DG protein